MTENLEQAQPAPSPEQPETLLNDDIAQETDAARETKRPRPFSLFLDVDPATRPLSYEDKRPVSFVGGIFGLSAVLFILGLLSFSGLSPAATEAGVAGLELPVASADAGVSFFPWVLFTLGFLALAKAVLSCGEKKKITIANRYVSLERHRLFRPFFKKTEALAYYTGVRYRTRLVNVYGLFSFVQHIIDLQHPDESLSVPLFIGHHPKDIQKKWKACVNAFNLPAVFNTAEGEVFRESVDIERPFIDLVREGKFEIPDMVGSEAAPATLDMDDDDVLRLKHRESLFSGAYLALGLFCAVFFSLASAIIIQREGASAGFIIGSFLFCTVFLVLIPGALYFRSQSLKFQKNGLWDVINAFSLFPLKKNFISFRDIELAEIVHNSFDLKYTFVIMAGPRAFHIGRGLPYEDLKWIQGYVFNRLTEDASASA